MPLLDERVQELITEYNRNPRCIKRYNPAAEAVYRARQSVGDPLATQFENHIIAGLIAFDMGRTIGDGFRERLHATLEAVRATPSVCVWREFRLSSTDLSAHHSRIVSVYECLAKVGTLHPEKQSHVAATKVLHWLFPDLFLMLDRRVAGTFRDFCGVKFLKSAQPGYCAERYVECLRLAQEDILTFGPEQFRLLETNTAEARIFDKIAWAAGKA
jgi:hypothetical protein